jgi:membrane protein
MKNIIIKTLNIIILTIIDVYGYGLINHAAALAFYFILSIMPSLLLIVISAKKLLTIYPDFTLKILEYIGNINPSLSNFINSTNILSTEGDIKYRYVGIFSLILAASLFFKALTRSFDIICKSMKKGFITGFFFPYIYTIISVILIILMAFIHIGSQIYINFFFDFMPLNILKTIHFLIESFFIPTFFIFITTFVSYYALSFKSIGLKSSLYGSLWFSLFLYFINILFKELYNPSFYNYLYGSIGYIIILLIWLYTIFILFLYFAAFSYNFKHYLTRIEDIKNKNVQPSLLDKIIIKLSD